MGAAPNKQQDEVQRFVERLSREERTLVVPRHELYEGDWDEMEADLRARLEGKPYIFKLADRIVDDLERIKHLRRFEQEHGVDLSDYINVEP